MEALKELKLEAEGNVSLREAVYQTLRRAILTGTFEPGDRLMEMKLAAQLDVSRTPVREAIHLLEKEMLVKQEPGRGVVVAGITLKQLRDVLEVRGMLEELAVQLACRRAREEDFALLNKKAESFARAVEEGKDVTVLAGRDVAFHDVIYRMTDNDRLIQLVADLWEQIYRYRIEYLKDARHGETLVREHQELVRALRERNEEAAVRTARLHIANQELAIVSRLEGKDRE
jgi:DNA-binding GntR family transcriptional regulator